MVEPGPSNLKLQLHKLVMQLVLVVGWQQLVPAGREKPLDWGTISRNPHSTLHLSV